MISKIKALRTHQGFMKYFKNTSWLFGEKILRMVVGLFVGIWVARYLGPEQFGLFSYAQSFVGLFTAIATLGLDGIVIRELVKDETRRDELIGTAFWLKFIGSIAVLLILAVAVNFTSNDHATNIIVFIVASATVFQSFNVVDFYFQAKVMSKYIVFANVISLFLSSIVKISLISNEAPLVAFAWTVLFDSFVLALGYVYFYFQQNEKLNKWKFNQTIAIDYLRAGTPLILSDIITLFIMKIDQVMIKELSNIFEVGIYAASVRLTEVWYIIAIVITNSLFPALLNAKEKSNELFASRFKNLLILLFLISLSLSITIQFAAHGIVGLLYGEAYNATSTILIVQIWTAVFVYMGFAGTKWLLVNNMQKQQFYRALFALVVNIILNYPLIKLYGALGAAYATLISWIAGVYLFHLFDNKSRELFVIQTKVLSGYFIFEKFKGEKK